MKPIIGHMAMTTIKAAAPPTKPNPKRSLFACFLKFSFFTDMPSPHQLRYQVVVATNASPAPCISS